MTKTIIQFGLLFICLVLMQVILFNHLSLFGIAVPVIFIYWILRLPVNLSQNWVLTLSFLLGLTIDTFSDTQGMNALACTLLAGLRLPVLRLYIPREDELTNPIPSIRSLGIGVYAKYIFTGVLAYCILYYTIEAFSFFNIWRLTYSIAASTLSSFIIIFALSTLLYRQRK